MTRNTIAGCDRFATEKEKRRKENGVSVSFADSRLPNAIWRDIDFNSSARNSCLELVNLIGARCLHPIYDRLALGTSLVDPISKRVRVRSISWGVCIQLRVAFNRASCDIPSASWRRCTFRIFNVSCSVGGGERYDKRMFQQEVEPREISQ